MPRPFALLVLLLTGCAGTPPAPALVSLRLIAINDFHGHLETPAFGIVLPDEAQPGKTQRVAAGGVAHLATAIAEMKRGHANTIVVGAGDLVSASPVASSIFLDEPAVNALGMAGLELSSTGNHEYDRGRAALARLQRGGCDAAKGCFDGDYQGATFEWLAANVFDTATGKTMLPGYVIREFEGIPVAFVGAVLQSTPQVVLRSGIAGLEFRDEAASINALIPEIRAKGVEAIVVLIHEGGVMNASLGTMPPASARYTCPGFEGPIVDIVKRLDRAVDVVVSGHTHQAYVCRIDGRLVTSSLSYGRVVTPIDITLERATRDVVASDAENVIVDPQRYPAAPRVAAYVQHIVELARSRATRKVGVVSGEFTTTANAAGESNLGDLVADAQFAAARASGAQFAFTNPGGLRAPLASNQPDGAVTFGDLYAVQPFGNNIVTMTLTGTQLLRALESQWRAPPDRTRILPVSEGLRYAWDARMPMGQRIVAGSVFVGERALEPDARYRVAMNDFLAHGGDGFLTFTEGTERTGGMLDVDALEAYVGITPRRAGEAGSRIRRIDPPR
jgi:5'-nucleotidase